MTSASIDSIVNLLLDHCRKADWCGWDPYDGLNSRLFLRLPFLRNKPCRLVFIQAMKRSPVNLRSLLGVPRGKNPKGIALFTSALVRLANLGLVDLTDALKLAEVLIVRRCPGRGHFCWGYNFDWQTRGILVRSTMPNIVCTTFVAHAFLDLYAATRQAAYLEVAQSAGRFITDELAADLPADAFCIRYFPGSNSTIHNASLLGAAFLARLGNITNNDRLANLIVNAIGFSLKYQKSDGSWPYGEMPSQTWVDSFHTGYNLLSLREIDKNLEISGLKESISRGYAFYRRNFFQDDGTVRYYSTKTYPIDAHSVGHALLTLATFADQDPTALDQAHRCADWAIKHLWSPHRHFFYYQFRPWFTNRISYMRWSQAWMLTGLVALLEREAAPFNGKQSRNLRLSP